MCRSIPGTDNLLSHVSYQTHDHSVCIRPPLPAFNLTSQTALFQLEGSFVSPSLLFLVCSVTVVLLQSQ